jgi:hypothetical protein
MSQRAVVCLTADEEQALLAKTRAGTTEHRIAERAKIVLLAHQGKTNLEIAEQLDTRSARVSKWRPRFAVVCVDEKPSIQALERAQGWLRLPNGKCVNG